MLEAALLGHDRIPGDALRFAFHGMTIEVSDLDAVLGDHGQVAVGKEEEVAGVVEKRGDVGGDEIFVLAETNDGGWSVAGGDDFVRFVDGDDYQREDSGKLLDRLAHGFFERRTMTVAGIEVVPLDEVGNDFGVGFGGELVAFFDQLPLERQIVLDDAVVHDDDLAACSRGGDGHFPRWGGRVSPSAYVRCRKCRRAASGG